MLKFVFLIVGLFFISLSLYAQSLFSSQAINKRFAQSFIAFAHPDTLIIGFKIAIYSNGVLNESKCYSNTLNARAKSSIIKIESGDKIYFEQIKAKDTSGKNILIKPFCWTVE